MNMYRRLGDEIATSESRELAEQLVTWHDAMVKHLRLVGRRPRARCGEDCPHEDAPALWAAARGLFGAKAMELAFLRSHGESRRQATAPAVRDRAAEMRA